MAKNQRAPGQAREGSRDADEARGGESERQPPLGVQRACLPSRERNRRGTVRRRLGLPGRRWADQRLHRPHTPRLPGSGHRRSDGLARLRPSRCGHHHRLSNRLGEMRHRAHPPDDDRRGVHLLPPLLARPEPRAWQSCFGRGSGRPGRLDRQLDGPPPSPRLHALDALSAGGALVPGVRRDRLRVAGRAHSRAVGVHAGCCPKGARRRERTGLPGDPDASRHPVHDRRFRLSRARSRSTPASYRIWA